MLTNVSGAHAVVLLVLLALEAVALVQVCRDRRRTQVVKVLWTVVILALPVIGVLGVGGELAARQGGGHAAEPERLTRVSPLGSVAA